MRPCNNCGEPIENRKLRCEKCEIVAAEPVAVFKASDQVNPKNNDTSSASLFWFITEIMIRTVLVACPVIVVLAVILILVLPVAAALVVAALVGLVAGFAWTLVEIHFQSGPH